MPDLAAVTVTNITNSYKSRKQKDRATQTEYNNIIPPIFGAKDNLWIIVNITWGQKTKRKSSLLSLIFLFAYIISETTTVYMYKLNPRDEALNQYMPNYRKTSMRKLDF